MASFRVEIDADLIKQLTSLGERTDQIAQFMLDDAGQILADELEAEIRAKHVDSGELADSIEANVYKDKNGNWVVWAYPEGKTKKFRHKGKVYARSKKGTMSKGQALFNADKLFWIEYGTSKQPARPFMEKMVKRIEGKIIRNMQEIFEREVGR